MIINKKADLTSKTLVSIILIIAGFIIILLVYFNLNFNQRVDEEICHESVIFRATLPGFSNMKEYVPLKCKTDKICITSGLLGGKCKEFENTPGVTKIKVNNKEQIEQAIARDIIECWRTMGEGKVSIFSQWLSNTYGFGNVYPSCVICSRIAFDKESLKKSGIVLNEVNVLNYMMTHAVPGKEISYYSYLAGKRGRISIDEKIGIKDLKIDDKGNLIQGENINVEIEKDSDNKEADELAVLFMQISAPTHTGVLRNTLISLGVGYGSAFAIAPSKMSKVSSGALKSPWTWAVLAIAGLYQQYSVMVNKGISAGYCGDVSVGDEAREGCSVIRTVDYDVEDISRYCSAIESIP